MILRRAHQIAIQVLGALNAALAFPHEILHYLPLQPWSKTIRIRYSIPKSEWTRPYIPSFAEVTGDFEKTIPTTVLRFASLAPTIFFGALGGLIGSFGPFRVSLISLLGLALLVSWATPSPTDISTFQNAEKYRQAGTLDADIPVERSSVFGTFLIFGSVFFNLFSLWFPI